MIRNDLYALLRLIDGHFRVDGKQFGKYAFVVRIEMLNQHKRRAGSSGKVAQKLRECFQAAGGCANADDRAQPWS